MRVYGFVVLLVALVARRTRGTIPADGAGPRRWPGSPPSRSSSGSCGCVVRSGNTRRDSWPCTVRSSWRRTRPWSSVSPSFAVLQLVVYPQIVFSLPIRWSIAGGLSIGVITGLAILAGSSGLETALPLVFYNLLTAGLVVAMAVWMRQTIAQSMERRALIEQLQTARLRARSRGDARPR